eukprot:213631-Chlamydomonas_euryale.AAC.2
MSSKTAAPVPTDPKPTPNQPLTDSTDPQTDPKSTHPTQTDSTDPQPAPNRPEQISARATGHGRDYDGLQDQGQLGQQGRDGVCGGCATPRPRV